MKTKQQIKEEIKYCKQECKGYTDEVRRALDEGEQGWPPILPPRYSHLIERRQALDFVLSSDDLYEQIMNEIQQESWDDDNSKHPKNLDGSTPRAIALDDIKLILRKHL